MNGKFKILIVNVVLLLSLVALSACGDAEEAVASVPDTPQYSLDERFNIYLSENGGGEVVYFTADHYEPGSMSAFAVVERASGHELWYIASGEPQRLTGAVTALGAPTVVACSERKIYIIDTVGNNGVGASYAFISVGGKPVQLYGAGEDLTSMGENEFCTFVSSTDRELVDGRLLGNAKRKYYLYFDGASLKEYGGIHMSEEHFLALNNSQKITDGIKDCGYKISEIIYRGNGIININCELTEGNSIKYENVTVKVIKGNCICIPNGTAQDGDYVTRSSFGGRYRAAAFPEIAVYPEENAADGY